LLPGGADVRLVEGGAFVRQATAFLPLCSLSLRLAGAADSALLDLIMPDAKIVFGANVSRIVASPLGQNFTKGQESSSECGVGRIHGRHRF
jgi:hypothetical protein